MLIKKIKTALDCKTSRELAKKLGVHESQISRLQKTGFHGEGTERLIGLLLDIIDRDHNLDKHMITPHNNKITQKRDYARADRL